MSTNESDVELSNTDSNITSNEPEDEIVLGGWRSKGATTRPSRRLTLKDNGSKVTEAAPESVGSHYPKRKRTSIFNENDLSESKLESAHTTAPKGSPTSPASTNKLDPDCQSPASPGARGVLRGTLRDSTMSEDEKKHSGIDLIDVRDHLRTRLQPNIKHGESLAEGYRLPAGPGEVAFEAVILSDHLVGLNHSQVKEYTGLHWNAASEESEDGRVAAEPAAVKEAIRRVKENSALENPERTRFAIDPLPGTRPTFILIGHWKVSSEVDPEERQAVYGVFSQNEVFLAKVVRQTRGGRYGDGNYPFGPNAMWIQCEEVEFEPHLKALNLQEVKEYCRVRQDQLDHGETSAERIGNETKAVYEAQIRVGTMAYTQPRIVTIPTFTASTQGSGDERINGPHTYGDHELHQSRQAERQVTGLFMGKLTPRGTQVFYAPSAPSLETSLPYKRPRHDKIFARRTQFDPIRTHVSETLHSANIFPNHKKRPANHIKHDSNYLGRTYDASIEKPPYCGRLNPATRHESAEKNAPWLHQGPQDIMPTQYQSEHEYTPPSGARCSRIDIRTLID